MCRRPEVFVLTATAAALVFVGQAAGWQAAPTPLPDVRPLVESVSQAKKTLGEISTQRQAVVDGLAQVRKRFDDMVRFKDIPAECARHVEDAIARFEDVVGPTLSSMQRRETELMQQLQSHQEQQQALLKAIQPITDLDAEVKAREQQLMAVQMQIEDAQKTKESLTNDINALAVSKSDAEKSLVELQGQQTDAIRDWLLQKYASQVGPPVTTILGDQTKVTMNTLFGTLTADYEHAMTPGEERPATVTFTPAVFAKDLSLPDINLGPELYDPGIPNGLQFTPTTVSVGGKKDEKFKLQDSVTIDPQNSITWTWKATVDEEFQGAKFKIGMNADEARPQGEELTVARLPLDIHRSPTEPLHVKYMSVIAAVVGGVAGAVAGWWLNNFVRWQPKSSEDKTPK